jgi:hypothetical protein
MTSRQITKKHLTLEAALLDNHRSLTPFQMKDNDGMNKSRPDSEPDSVLAVLRGATEDTSPSLEGDKLLLLIAQAKALVADDLKAALPRPPYASGEEKV